jgi:hypothetical protein
MRCDEGEGVKGLSKRKYEEKEIAVSYKFILKESITFCCHIQNEVSLIFARLYVPTVWDLLFSHILFETKYLHITCKQSARTSRIISVAMFASASKRPTVSGVVLCSACNCCKSQALVCQVCVFQNFFHFTFLAEMINVYVNTISGK